MSNRCSNCNKFVSVEFQASVDNDPDIEEQLDGQLEITIPVHITKVCAECGQELATKDIETIDHTDKSDFEDV